MVGPVAGAEEKYDGWTKSILIDTIIDTPSGFDKDCYKAMYRTLEMKWPDYWEQIWNEHENVKQEVCYIMDDFENGVATEVCEKHGNEGAVRIETDEDFTSLVISISHEDFKKGQIYFNTDGATILIDLALVYRDSEGNMIEQLTQNFTLNVTNNAINSEVNECQFSTLKKKSGARYDQVVSFPAMSGNDTTMESWAMFHLDQPIQLDWT